MALIRLQRSAAFLRGCGADLLLFVFGILMLTAYFPNGAAHVILEMVQVAIIKSVSMLIDNQTSQCGILGLSFIAFQDNSLNDANLTST